jgi:hypothetical protein
MGVPSSTVFHYNLAEIPQRSSPQEFSTVASWPNSRVLTWLLKNEMTHCLHTFASQGVSGSVLLEYAEDHDKIDALFAPGIIEPKKPTPTQIDALKHAVDRLLKRANAPAVKADTNDEVYNSKDPKDAEQGQIPKTLTDWRRTIRTSAVAHDRMCRYYGDRGFALTMIVVTLNTIVTSAIFTTISDSSSKWLTIAAGSMSVVSAVLTAIRSASGYETLAEAHRSSGLRFSKLWVSFDDMHGMLKVSYTDEEAPSRKDQAWADWFKDFQEAIDTSPVISPAVWQHVRGDPQR